VVAAAARSESRIALRALAMESRRTESPCER